jgi:hypothetical protein
VYTEGPSLKVRDLEKNKLVPEDYQEIIFEEEGIWEPINPPIISYLFAGIETDIHDPYTDLIPCSWFRDLNECPDYITYEQILVDLKSKFAKYGLYYDEIERT